MKQRLRRRRVKVASAVTAGLAAAAIPVIVIVSLTGDPFSQSTGAMPPLNRSSAHVRVRQPSPVAPAHHHVSAAMTSQPGFITFVAGHNLVGPIVSATSIAAGNSSWSTANNNNAIVAAARSGQAYWTPSVNPAHSRIVYVKGSVGQIGRFAGEGNLVIANIEGSHPREVTDADSDSQPAWSPNGKEIAFLRHGQIWLMTSTGSHQRALGVGLVAHTLAWSPDGRKLAVGSGNEPVRIAIINIARRSIRWFTPDGHIEQYDPAWSPNGKELVYGQTGPDALFVSNLSGTHVRRLTSCRTPYCTQDVDPAWSPDGTQIAFVRSIYGVQQIAIVKATGGKVRMVTSGPEQHSFPAW